MLQENDSFSNSRIVVFVHRRIRLICLLARHSIRPEMLPISLRCMDILLQS
jgi:hypothetical protein